MRRAALKDGVTLMVLSATRNFAAQKGIWDAKYNGQRLSEGKNMQQLYPDPESRVLAILRYSAMPGTSRHHWGTDIDLVFARNNSAAMLTNLAWEKGAGLRAYQWLSANAAKFGFCQPYKNPPGKRRVGFQRGYEIEKWHWSYRPLSLQYTQQIEQDKSFTVSGFLGDGVAAKYVRSYILNIHEDCLVTP